MTYCTIEQLTDRFGARMLQQLSDRGDFAPETPAIDADLFARAVADADAAIDGALLGRYTLPVASVPRLLTDLSIAISIYKAHGQTVPDKIRDDYRDAMKTLAQISEGKVRLDIDGVELPSSGGDGEVLMTETDRPMTVQSMKGYI